MPLNPGARLGPYEVVAAIGAGGMGEVYRARDAKLNRDVALKILPPASASDPDRLARFHREAQVLASLNHPHIAAIYGFEDSGETHALVLEFVDGPTLADRIAQGPIPIDEALPIAMQIAEALEAAHELGIIHRDLKPANIKVKSDGSVKVLDFGLAKLAEPGIGTRDSGFEGALSMSPTITSPAMMTGVGVMLGTAAYMSPEQARGKTVDKRADIWAYGCVLYEMLAGTRPFGGSEITDTLAFVITKEPDWTALPVGISLSVRRLLRRCLEKDVRHRLRDIGDAQPELLPGEPNDVDSSREVTRTRRYFLTSVVACGFFAVTAVMFAVLYFRQAPAQVSLTKLQLLPPPKSTFGSMSISPDGRRIAFTAIGPSGKEQLWVRQLDTVSEQLLAETDGASYPFWSPDSRFIGFFAGNKLKKIDVSGGSPQTVCDLVNNRGGGRGGTWNRDGIILFSAEPYGPEPIYQVSAAGGGEPRAMATHEPSDQQSHHHWPSFLPDGRHFVYFAANEEQPERTGIYLGSLDANESRLLIRAETSGAYAVRPPAAPRGSDYIFFVREQTLMAQPLDRQTLEVSGDAIPIADDVGVDGFGNIGKSLSSFSVSENGVLVYGAGARGAQLTWSDRDGKQLGLLGSPGINVGFNISPDGQQVALQREDGRGGSDIWLLDATRGTALRFTSDPVYHAAPVWSPDGLRITFFAIHDGRWQLWEKASNEGGSEKLLLKSNTDLVTEAWSPDGRLLLYGDINPKNRNTDLSMLAMAGGTGQPRSIPFVHTPFDENFAEFSPDGKWVVYQSNESGRYEIYARPVAPDGSAGAGKWRISTDGGTEPHWRQGGNEIFYIAPDNKLMAVEVRTGATFEVGVPRALFSTRPSGVVRYAVTRDGQRFLVSVPTEDAAAPVTVVVNWFEALKRSAPVQ